MSLLRAWARTVARRLVSGAPRVPHAPRSGRQPPQTRSAWQGAPEARSDAAAERSEEEPSEASLDLELEAAEVARRLREAPEGIVLLDIREPHELRQGHAVGAWLLPMNSVPQRLTELPRDKTLAVYCAAGVRSYGVSHWLREQGFVDTWSVPGGLGALAHEGVETTFPPFGTTPTLLARVRLASGVEGEVQQVSATDDGLRLHVRVPSTSGSEVFAGVDAASVEPL